MFIDLNSQVSDVAHGPFVLYSDLLIFFVIGVINKEAYNAMRKQDHLGEKFLVIIKDYGHYLKSKERPMDEKFYHPNNFDQIGYIEKIQPHSRRGSLEQTINAFKVLGQYIWVVCPSLFFKLFLSLYELNTNFF